MIRKYVLGLAALTALMSQVSCKGGSSSIEGKWRLSIPTTKLDSIRDAQFQQIDTMSVLPAEAAMFGLPNNLDSAKAMLKDQITAQVENQKKQLNETVYEFRKDSVVKVYLSSNPAQSDSSNKWVAKEKSFMIISNNPNPMQQGAPAGPDTLRFDILHSSSDSLSIKINDPKMQEAQAAEPLNYVKIKETK